MNKEQKRINGLYNQQGGLISEDIIKKTLETIGYYVEKPPPNTPAYDLFATKNRTRLLIQVKTDMNNDGKYPKATEQQKQNLIRIAHENQCIPIFIYCNPYKNEYFATDMNDEIINLS